MASRILSFKASNCLWLIGVTLIFDSTSQIIVQRCQIASPRLPNDLSSAVNNTILKNRAQNIECSFGYAARSPVLLKPNVANILLFNFCLKQHGPIAIANYGPEAYFNAYGRVFCAPNASILLVYIPAKIKMSFI